MLFTQSIVVLGTAVSFRKMGNEGRFFVLTNRVDSRSHSITDRGPLTTKVHPSNHTSIFSLVSTYTPVTDIILTVTKE